MSSPAHSAKVGKRKASTIFNPTCKSRCLQLQEVPTPEKQEQYKNRAQYIGRFLTVKFFDRTDDGIPRFPVGKMFRADEDLDKSKVKAPVFVPKINIDAILSKATVKPKDKPKTKSLFDTILEED